MLPIGSLRILRATPTVKQAQSLKSIFYRRNLQVKRRLQLLLALLLGFRGEQLSHGQRGLDVCGTAAVSGKKSVVPFRQVGRFGKQGFEFGDYDIGDILGKTLRKGIDGLAEPSELDVELSVVGVNIMSGKEALKGKGIKF